MNFPSLLAESGGLVESLHQTALTFGLNGWLLISQIVSFSIVCYCLKRFAYDPVLTVLEQRRQKIEQGLADARRIKEQLAESEARHRDILAKANADAQKMIDEAKASAQALADKRTQAAIAEAEQIIAKAHTATTQERSRMFAELKQEVARLVVDTTARVSGKVLTSDDQRRLSEEASREIAA